MAKYIATEHSSAQNRNHSIQGNKNNDVYWQSRGKEGRPEDWDREEDEEE